MVTVIALQGFEHNGTRRRGDQFKVSEHQARALVRAGLVVVKAPKQGPTKAAGEKSSASPVGQVSPQTTLSSSKRGGKRRKGAPSSSQTPPSA